MTPTPSPATDARAALTHSDDCRRFTTGSEDEDIPCSCSYATLRAALDDRDALRAEVATLREDAKATAYMQRPAYHSARWALSVFLAKLRVEEIARVVRHLDSEEATRMQSVLDDFSEQIAVRDSLDAARKAEGRET